MKGIIATIIVLGLIAFGAYYLWPKQKDEPVVTDFASCVAAGYPILESYPEQCKTPSGAIFINNPNPVATTTDQSTPVENNSPVRYVNVSENELVTSPLIVRGEATAGWYFEASFPVKLLDANGKVLAQAPATTTDDWTDMNGFHPFTSSALTFTTTTATGTLVLHNDNPSGLAKYDQEVRIPVRFKAEEKTIKLYYYNSSKDKDSTGNILCSSRGLVAVSRTVPVSITPIQDAIRELLKGTITDAEKKSGLISNFPLAGVSLTGASLATDGTLTLTFTDPQHATSGGACKINILRAQIEATAKQFPEVKAVRIMPATLFQP